MKHLLFATLLFCVISAAAQTKSGTGKKFTGRWQSKSSARTTGEYWVKVNDSLWSGIGYYIKGADTVVTETVELKAEGRSLYYIPTAKHQNNDQPVRFKMTSYSKGVFIFENAAHDFPKRIVYDFSARDKLHAYVDGGGRPIHFYYFRVK